METRTSVRHPAGAVVWRVAIALATSVRLPAGAVVWRAAATLMTGSAVVIVSPAGSGVILDWLCMMRIYYSPAGPRMMRVLSRWRL